MLLVTVAAITPAASTIALWRTHPARAFGRLLFEVLPDGFDPFIKVRLDGLAVEIIRKGIGLGRD
jgi:hypothetical protein